MLVFHLSRADPESQSLSDLLFIAVRCGAVNVSIPAVQSSENCLLHLRTHTHSIMKHFVISNKPSERIHGWYLSWGALPRAEADHGHPLPRREGHVGAHGSALRTWRRKRQWQGDVCEVRNMQTPPPQSSWLSPNTLLLIHSHIWIH